MEPTSPPETEAPATPAAQQVRRRRHRRRKREPQVDKRQIAILAGAFVLLVVIVFNRGAKDAIRRVIHQLLPVFQGLIRAEILALILVGLTVAYLVVPQADQKILQWLGVGRRRRKGSRA